MSDYCMWIGSGAIPNDFEITIQNRSAKSSFVYNLQALQWTTDEPTKPGWYWVYCCDGDDKGPEILEYWNFDGGRLMIDWDGDFITHWLGPLPVPEKPQEKAGKE